MFGVPLFICNCCLLAVIMASSESEIEDAVEKVTDKVFVPEQQKLDIIDKISERYKAFLGDAKNDERGREAQAVSWKDLRDYLEKEYGTKYQSGSYIMNDSSTQ